MYFAAAQYKEPMQEKALKPEEEIFCCTLSGLSVQMDEAVTDTVGGMLGQYRKLRAWRANVRSRCNSLAGVGRCLLCKTNADICIQSMLQLFHPAFTGQSF